MWWMIAVRKNKAFHAMNDSGSQKQKHFMRWMIHVCKSQSISCNEWFWFAKTKAFHAMNDSHSQKPKHFMQWMILVRKNKSISCNEWFTFAKTKAFHAMNDSWITRIAKAKVFHAKKRITTSSLLNTNGCVTSDQCYLVKKVVCYCWGRKSNWLGRAQKAWLTAVPLHSLFPIVEKKISEGRPCTNQTHREFDVRPYI